MQVRKTKLAKHAGKKERLFSGLILFCVFAISGCAGGGRDTISPLPESGFENQEEISLITNSETGSLHLQTGDVALSLRAWNASAPAAALIALHGMNDYGHAFEAAGTYWAEHGITTYAYDQRGFGQLGEGEVSITKNWPGTKAFGDDLRSMIVAVKSRHPGLPVYVLGHSMGAAVVMTANAEQFLSVDGIILASPAIWGGRRMPLLYRMTLNLAHFFAPGKSLSGKRARRQATDNIPVLRGMQADSLVIKETPIRAIKGIVSLMGDANQASGNQQGNILFVYGCRDEIIPVKAMAQVGDRIESQNPEIERIVYPEGWHLLFRDLQAETVWEDILDWIGKSNTGQKAIAQNFSAGETGTGEAGNCDGL